MADVVTRERGYRATFGTDAGHVVSLDFFAENRGLARDHAGTVARDENLVLLTVRRQDEDEMVDPGAIVEVAS